MRRQEAGRVERDRLLRAHHDRVDEAAHEHESGDDQIHDADALVISRSQVLAPEPAPFSELGEKGGRTQRQDRHEDGRPHDDRLVVRDRLKR